jgi:gamma-F420-2:alpha-L-glutamate ligase
MKVWILTKQSEAEYENMRLIQEFAVLGVSSILVHPNKFNVIIRQNGYSNNIKYDGDDIELPNALVVRTGSGTDFHALTILRELERHNIPCINSSTATIIAKDKLLSGQILACHDISVPKTILVKFPIQNVQEYTRDLVGKELGFPCVLKVNTGSFGHGVHLCRSEEEFFSLIQLLQTVAPTSQIILQEFISTKIGHDLRVWVVNGQVIGAMERKSADGDFRANISNGGTGTVYDLNTDIIDMAGRAASVLGLDIAGVDLLFHGDNFTVCEVNSSPGFSGFEKYCERNIAKVIAEYVVSTVR